MHNPRRLAFIAGAFYLLTVITSIPALVLKRPVLLDPALLSLPAGGTPLRWAALLEVILAVSCVGTAVVLFPVVRRVNEVSALGFVAARTIEATIIVAGVLAMLSLLAVPRTGATEAMETTLVGLHDWAFLLGPGLIPAINALLLGSLLFTSGLVPRVIPAIGLVGAFLLIASAVGTLFGVVGQVSLAGSLCALPIAAWEITLGVWLVVKGFRTDAVDRLYGTVAVHQERPPVTV